MATTALQFITHSGDHILPANSVTADPQVESNLHSWLTTHPKGDKATLRFVHPNGTIYSPGRIDVVIYRTADNRFNLELETEVLTHVDHPHHNEYSEVVCTAWQFADVEKCIPHIMNLMDLYGSELNAPENNE